MKKKVLFLILSLLLVTSTFFTFMMSKHFQDDLNNYKNKLSSIQNKKVTKNNGINKKYENKMYYSSIIRLINKYNGEIKNLQNDGKGKENIEADIIVYGDEIRLSNFIGELRKYKNLRKINSIALDDRNSDKNKYSLEVNAQFDDK
ncbi:MAG: hypothetical protein PHX70_12345 [Clostridium sp.]|nr:hypothetical protein [Clostridium sp.]